MSNEHPVENLMRSTMENLRDMIDVNTVIGEAVETKDGSYIIPISKVTFGFASGGSEFGSQSKPAPDKDAKHPFGGGSGAGVTVKPVAFLVVRDDNVRLLPVDQNNTYDRIVDSVPQVLDMFKGFYNDMSANKSKKSSNCKDNYTNSECDDSDSSSNNLY
ncbi:GerW family sporulation protein [Clostridium carnis]